MDLIAKSNMRKAQKNNIFMHALKNQKKNEGIYSSSSDSSVEIDEFQY